VETIFTKIKDILRGGFKGRGFDDRQKVLMEDKRLKEEEEGRLRRKARDFNEREKIKGERGMGKRLEKDYWKGNRRSLKR
jgi:phosphopantothenoylcysteine synthetase/decarboxylase